MILVQKAMFGLNALKVRTNPDFQGQFSVPAKNYHLCKFLLFSSPPDVYNHISCEAFKNTNRRLHNETSINSCIGNSSFEVNWHFVGIPN